MNQGRISVWKKELSRVRGEGEGTICGMVMEGLSDDIAAETDPKCRRNLHQVQKP